MRRFFDLRFNAIAITVLCCSGCARSYFGTYPDGLADFPHRQISPVQAVEAAEPYLDETFKLCRDDRGPEGKWFAASASIRVKLRGQYFYILKDNYPAMNANYGFSHSVKVDARTGTVTPPK